MCSLYSILKTILRGCATCRTSRQLWSNLRLSAFIRQSEGFSLLEAALVLAIVGTVAGVTLPIMISHWETKCHNTTKKHLRYIQHNIGLYYAMQKIIPCPAPDEDSGEIGSCSKDHFDSHRGFVPFKELGIPKAMTRDGYGRPIKYAVDINSTLTSRASSDPLPSTLIVHDETEQPVVSAASKNQPIIVLYGQGHLTTDTLGPFERINENNSPHYIDAPFTINDEAPHRHILLWATFDQLYFLYGQGRRQDLYHPHTNTIDLPGEPRPHAQDQISTSAKSSTTPTTSITATTVDIFSEPQ